MDVLDNYKKAWDNQPEETKKVSKIDIYKMSHSRSSSIVKWIFIIGILEFVILNSSYFFIDIEKQNVVFEELGISNIVFYSQIVVYLAVFYFMVQFYLNYKRISVIDSTKNLMQKILKTRKTVRNYVILNLGYLTFIIVVASIASIANNELLNSTEKIIKFILMMIVITVVFLGILYGFYQLLYGILLRKLNRNYKELAKLDELN